MQDMAEAAIAKAHGFNPQNLANTLWAYGKLDHDPGAQLLDIFCQCILRELGKFSAQNTSNMLWAFARLGHNPGPLLLDAAAKHATQNVTAFAPQVWGAMLWMCLPCACTVVAEPDGTVYVCGVHCELQTRHT